MRKFFDNAGIPEPNASEYIAVLKKGNISSVKDFLSVANGEYLTRFNVRPTDILKIIKIKDNLAEELISRDEIEREQNSLLFITSLEGAFISRLTREVL